MLFLIRLLFVVATLEIDNVMIPSTMIKDMVFKVDSHLNLIKQYHDNFKKYLFTTKLIISNKKIQNICVENNFRWIKTSDGDIPISFKIYQIANALNNTLKMEKHKKIWAKYVDIILKVKGFLKIADSLAKNFDENTKMLYNRIYYRTYLSLNNEVNNTEYLVKSDDKNIPMNLNLLQDFNSSEKMPSIDKDSNVMSRESIKSDSNILENHIEKIFGNYSGISDKYKVVMKKETAVFGKDQQRKKIISNDDLFKYFLIFSTKYKNFAINEIHILKEYQNNLEVFKHKIEENVYSNDEIYSNIDKAISYILEDRFIESNKRKISESEECSIVKKN